MRFNPDRCASCGGPPRTFHSRLGLTLDGKMADWETFFFCSDDCLERELNRYMPDDVALGKTIGDDRQYKALLRDYENARKYYFPDGLLYSNEELKERREFDVAEQRIISQYEDRWATKRSTAITNAIRQISATWAAHHRQEWQQQEKEKRLEEERLRALYRDFSDAILPLETRFSGMWIVSPPGRGKTTLLHTMFLEDIQRKASIILMDSKGDLINPIKELKTE